MTVFRFLLYSVFFALVSTGCGGGGGGTSADGDNNSTDVPESEVTFTFPKLGTITLENRMLIQGTINNFSEKSMYINGRPVIAPNENGVWSAMVDLIPGENQFTVTTVYQGRITSQPLASIVITRAQSIGSLTKFDIDEESGRVYVIDRILKQNRSYDWVNASFSDVGRNLPFARHDIAVNTNDDEIFTTNIFIYRIGFDGEEKPSLPLDGSASGFNSIVFDDVNRRLLSVGSASGEVAEIDLDTRELSIIEDRNNPSRARATISIAFNQEAQFLYTLGYNIDLEGNEIRKYNLDTNIWLPLSIPSSSDDMYPLDIVSSITYVDSLNQILVTQGTKGTILRVDSDTGERSLFIDFKNDEATRFVVPGDIVHETSSNTVVVLSNATEEFLRLDLEGNILERNNYSFNQPNIVNKLYEPSALALVPDGNVGYVADQALNAVIEIDLSSGERSVLTRLNASTNNTDNRFPDMAYDTEQSRLILIDKSINNILFVDSDSGSQERLLSDTDVPTILPVALALNQSASHVYVVSRTNQVFLVDLLNGDFDLVSDISETDLSEATAVAVDSLNDRLLITVASGDQGLYSVDLSDGSRRLIMSLTEPSDVVMESEQIAVVSHRVVSSLNSRIEIEKIDLQSDSVLGRFTVSERGQVLDSPVDVEYHPAMDQFYVLDQSKKLLSSYSNDENAIQIVVSK